MLTIGEHDSMWKDVMGRQVPNATEYLKRLAESYTAMAYINYFKEAKELGSVTEEDYKYVMETAVAQLLHLQWKEKD